MATPTITGYALPIACAPELDSVGETRTKCNALSPSPEMTSRSYYLLRGRKNDLGRWPSSPLHPALTLNREEFYAVHRTPSTHPKRAWGADLTLQKKRVSIPFDIMNSTRGVCRRRCYSSLVSSCVLEESSAAELEVLDLGQDLLLLPGDLLQQVLHAQHTHHLQILIKRQTSHAEAEHRDA